MTRTYGYVGSPTRPRRDYAGAIEDALTDYLVNPCSCEIYRHPDGRVWAIKAGTDFYQLTWDPATAQLTVDHLFSNLEEVEFTTWPPCVEGVQVSTYRRVLGSL